MTPPDVNIGTISRLDQGKSVSRSDMPIQARTEFAAAINQLAYEKGVDTEVILDAIRQAALAAYRKDLSYRSESIPDDFDALEATINPVTGEISIWRSKENITPPGFARIAAQTAKQVITQKLHEAEKGAIISEYEGKIGTVISGSVQRQDGNICFVDLGKAEGILPLSEQTRGEIYSQNQRLKLFIKEIRDSIRGPEVVVSRSEPGLVKGLFAMEVPEISTGAVEIKEIAREAGGRSKVAVISHQDGVDPVGSLVGQKGVRVQAVINELSEEKIDIIQFSEDPARFIAAALSPAKDVQVELDEKNQTAKVTVPATQLSLAIGRGGQNVRLAAKLTGWKIDLEGAGEDLQSDGLKQSEEGGQQVEEVDKVGKPKKEKVKRSKEKKKTSASLDYQAQEAKAVEGSVAQAASEDVKKVEENIDEAVMQESQDGAVEPEPSEGEQTEAAADAEEDMTENKKG